MAKSNLRVADFIRIAVVVAIYNHLTRTLRP